MLKFFRRYQKWMLVVFCGGLMIAFLIQPVMSIFFPDPGKQTIATVYDGESITFNDRKTAVGDLQLHMNIHITGKSK